MCKGGREGVIINGKRMNIKIYMTYPIHVHVHKKTSIIKVTSYNHSITTSF